MYALGTHHKGLDPNFWAKGARNWRYVPIHAHPVEIFAISSGWLFGHDPPEYDYDEGHDTVKLMEADAWDADAAVCFSQPTQ